MPVQLAGGEQGTLLSEAGPALLPFFTMRDACALRLVCQELLAAVREHPWEDKETLIQGSIADWRACFLRARCANVLNNCYSPSGAGPKWKTPTLCTWRACAR